MAEQSNQPKKKKTLQSNKSQPTAKPVRMRRLFKGKTPQKKREKTALKTQSRQANLEKQEELYTNERYVSPEEALGPTIYNERYLKKASVYRFLRYGILILLVVFLLGMLNLFRDEITLENFRYLMRNVNFELRTELGEEGVISYDSNPLNTFAVYKDSLAQLSDRKIALYDGGGRSSYTGNLDYASPALCASEKYLLAYDRAGGDYSLYTGFSQVHTASTGYPIADADIVDEGIFVIASRSKEYLGVVEVYSSSFQMMNKIQKNKYIASVDLSADGKNLLISSYYVGDSGICTELMILAIDSDTPSLLLTVEGTMPWEAAWLHENRFVLVCDEGVKFYDNSGKIHSEYGFSEKNVIEYRVSQSASRIALLCREGSDTAATRLYLLNADGKVVLDRSFSGRARQITFFEDRLILLSDNTVWSITEDGTAESFHSDTAIQAIAVGKDTLYLCTATRVVTPRWKQEGK